jgi:pyruvate formate lyase activating enzyme
MPIATSNDRKKADMIALADRLDALTRPGDLFETLPDGILRCTACAHRCRIQPGKRGICQVRFNREGTLQVPWGYVAALQIDPIEKKPFAHVLPGAQALTFGMLGCDFHCGYCQNWVTSQALRDPAAGLDGRSLEEVSPADLIHLAKSAGAQAVISSYNEPLITSEWAADIFKLAKADGLLCAYVSNGNATPEALAYLAPYLSACKVDLKTMQDRQYRQLGGVLQNVLDTIQLAHDKKLWVEVVTLVVPGFNDSPEELWEAARFLASVSTDIPWHVTAFHPDYKMNTCAPTTARSLQTAADIGQEAGLKYVYAGNLPGRVGSLEDTFCPHCQTLLIQRRGYSILDYRLTADGTCPNCGYRLAGLWPENPQSVTLNQPGQPRRLERRARWNREPPSGV